MKIINKLIPIIILIFAVSCSRSYREEDLTQKVLSKEDSLRIKEEKIEDRLEKNNQIVIKKELERIKSYVKRNSWQVKEIDGVFFEIISQSKGKKIQNAEIISLNYQCFLLNGEKVYDSKKDGKLNIKIGSESACPLGLQIALTHLYHDCKARIIIPSSLAYGLSGDNDRIPPAATLIYEVEIE